MGRGAWDVSRGSGAGGRGLGLGPNLEPGPGLGQEMLSSAKARAVGQCQDRFHDQGQK